MRKANKIDYAVAVTSVCAGYAAFRTVRANLPKPSGIIGKIGITTIAVCVGIWTTGKVANVQWSTANALKTALRETREEDMNG